MSGLILSGYGEKNLIITGGLGEVFKVEVREIPPSAAFPFPRYEVKVFKLTFPVTGDKVFKLKETFLITGLRDLELLLIALEEDTPSDEDQLLSLLSIYESLKLRVKWELASEEEKTKMAELRERLRKLGEKLGQEKGTE